MSVLLYILLDILHITPTNEAEVTKGPRDKVDWFVESLVADLMCGLVDACAGEAVATKRKRKVKGMTSRWPSKQLYNQIKYPTI